MFGESKRNLALIHEKSLLQRTADDAMEQLHQALTMLTTAQRHLSEEREAHRADMAEMRAQSERLIQQITAMQREGFRVVAAGEPASAVTLDPAILDAIADVPEEARPEVMRWALQQRGDPVQIAKDIREGR